MKQKLFENVGGNQFKLITESVEEINPNTKLVREGLKKVFGAGTKTLSYKRLQGVGLGYIRHVEEAKKTALQEARILAKEYGYTENENAQSFVKEDGEMSDNDRGDAENGQWEKVPTSSHSVPYNPNQSDEKREVEIGHEIIAIIESPGMDQAMETEKGKLRQLAEELIQLHGQK